MRILDKIVQSSPEWWAARRGRITASAMDRIITSKKAEPSAQAEDYLAELIADVVFQGPNYFSDSARNKPPNRAMREGVEREPEARKWLEHELECQVKQVGLLVHDNGLWSCSPDGLIIDDSGEVTGLELKCPLLETQAKYLLKPDRLLNDYRQQVHGSLLVSGLPLWRLVSYAPPLGPVMIEVRPDNYTVALKDALLKFTDLYDESMVKLLGYNLAGMLTRLHSEES